MSRQKLTLASDELVDVLAYLNRVTLESAQLACSYFRDLIEQKASHVSLRLVHEVRLRPYRENETTEGLSFCAQQDKSQCNRRSYPQLSGNSVDPKRFAVLLSNALRRAVVLGSFSVDGVKFDTRLTQALLCGNAGFVLLGKLFLRCNCDALALAQFIQAFAKIDTLAIVNTVEQVDDEVLQACTGRNVGSLSTANACPLVSTEGLVDFALAANQGSLDISMKQPSLSDDFLNWLVEGHHKCKNAQPLSIILYDLPETDFDTSKMESHLTLYDGYYQIDISGSMRLRVTVLETTVIVKRGSQANCDLDFFDRYLS